MEIRHAGAAGGPHRPARLRDARARRTGGSTQTETLDINGLKAWTAIVRGDPSPYGQSTNVRYIIIYYGNLMWVFKGASRSGIDDAGGRSVLPLHRATRSAACAPTSSGSLSRIACASMRASRRHDDRGAREGRPDQEVPGAAAAAVQQTSIRTASRSPATSSRRFAKGLSASDLTSRRPSFVRRQRLPAPARDGSRGSSPPRASPPP